MTVRQRAVEGKMLGHLGMTAEAQARLTAHNERQTDWHGRCGRCRVSFTGSLATLRGPCPNCGYGGEDASSLSPS